MGKLRKQKQAVIATVARRFSATWEKGDGDSPDAYVTIVGKMVLAGGRVEALTG